MSAVVEREAARESVERLERFLLQCEQTDLKTRHFLVDGPNGTKLYGREVTIPAGTVVTGAAHLTDHLVMCCGDVSVSTSDGVKRLVGVSTFPAKAGTKRVAVAHADTIWTTFHVVTAEDIPEIEAELTAEAARLQTRTLGIAQPVIRLLED